MEHITNKTNVHHTDNTWNIDKIQIRIYGGKNNKYFRIIFTVADNFSKRGWSNPLEIKDAKAINELSKKILTVSKRKPKLIENTNENLSR